jgi:L-threonylcarbamoyladenylate synthase
MAVVMIKQEDPGTLEHAVQVLKNGGLVAIPTDTVYGLACALGNPIAIKRLYEVKGRDSSKPIAVLIGDTDQLKLVASHINRKATRLAKRYWPGALTLVLPRLVGLPDILSSQPTVGVRMPDHPFVLYLLRTAGPLAVTSANLSGAENPKTAQDVFNQLGDRIDLTIDGGRCPGGVPSTVVDCSTTDLRILRVGAIPVEDILKVAGEED